ncbi:hypothetical protein CNECB9_600024 [Cupriavidus necator]|uniref:Uncharacterized protein n=1 Tax=Cupriavidus necator TaxID=106590 RepID=A0A1K0IRP4_CUPNE|nr:hypothetical protein CNECB9_600024 [Cupriavidus necator]
MALSPRGTAQVRVFASQWRHILGFSHCETAHSVMDFVTRLAVKWVG